MAIATVKDVSYHISNELKAYWDKYSLASMKKINRDKVDIVAGGEGVGKSQWVIQQFGYLEPSAFETPEKFVSRIAFTPDEFFDLVRTVKNGVVIFDEAFRGFASRSALSKTNKRLVQALMEMRQNNNIVFIVLPSLFLLDIYPAMLRSNALFDIYLQKNSGKRAWRGYNKFDKNKIYQVGIKKGWTYNVKTFFRGYFYNKFPGGDAYLKAYLDKKSKSLREMDKEPEKKVVGKPHSDTELLFIKAKYKELKSYKKLSEWCRNAGMDYSHEHLRTKLKQFDEKKARKEGLTGILGKTML